jgi:ATP-dependent DNA helicase MPH1
MCFRSLTDEAEGSSSDKPSGLKKDPAFQALLDELELQKSRGFAIHPKLEKLKTLVVHHFGQRLHNGVASNADEHAGEDTRAMVFVTFREAVDEIVNFLNQESPLLRATKFIGQGIDRKGNKGLAQREQLDVSLFLRFIPLLLLLPTGDLLTFFASQIINQFKNGVFNVLVATSVGEEGLDIGEVDLIVCYDAQKTPIRMVSSRRS